MGAKFDSDDSDSVDFSEINVTPFVDVVLVLLVIFMVTAPTMMKNSIGIQLPKAESGDGASLPTSVGIAVTKTGQIILEGQMQTPETLESELKNLVQRNPDIQAVLSADTETKHGDVVVAIDKVKLAGIKRFAFEVRKP